MRSEFVYSLAAFAAFPIAVNAEIDAVSIGKITAAKDATATDALKEAQALVKGKYSFIGSAATGTAGKKVTVTVLNGSTTVVSDEFEVGKDIKLDFTLTENANINVQVQGEAADADYVISASAIKLDFDFAKVVELLQIEYNKVTEVLRTAEYGEKAADAQNYSTLYNRIVAIGNADYKFYTTEEEGLKDIYADQTNVIGLQLYTDIQTALKDVTAKEKNYQLGLLDGDDGLKGLDARYTALGADYEITYVTGALTEKKNAAVSARSAYDADATGDKLLAAKNAIAAYKAELEKEEAVKDTNEKAKKDIDDAWTATAGSYYSEARAKIIEQYNLSRYANLGNEALAALDNIINSKDKTDIDAAIDKAYKDKAAEAKKGELVEKQIPAFQQQLTRTVANFNEVKDALAEIYKAYDKVAAEADALVKDAAGFLVEYKDAVDAAVADYLSLIQGNDKFDTVKNLTDEKIKEKTDAIKAAEDVYKAQAAIYADYTALTEAVAAETTSLNGVKTEIDKDAKDTKKLDEKVFKPTTIWESTITTIESLIKNLSDLVDANERTADKYKDSDEYKNHLKNIQARTADFKANALAATATYAEIAGQFKTADDLRKALLNPDTDPKVNLTTLNVWNNQVTIDDAVKARTPYRSYINEGDGSITKAIAGLQNKLNDAPNKKDEAILTYLEGLATDVKAVTDGTKLMNDIKANYTNDEKKFDDQIEQQECDGIKININSKAIVFTPDIEALQKRIKEGEFGNKRGALLQEEIDAITKKINEAKDVAAKTDATKEELTKAYDSIKNLDTEDIAKAKTKATDYASAFRGFSDNYNNLVGTDVDASTYSTWNGLNKKVAEQWDLIGSYTLLDAQEAIKRQVADVSVTKKEKNDGDNEVDVTYTIKSIENFINDVKGKEELDIAAVTKYQGIIEDLKKATDVPVKWAERANNDLKTLDDIDFNKAKEDVLKADPNQDGYYYKLLTGTAFSQYTGQFNTYWFRMQGMASQNRLEDDWKVMESNIKALVNNVNGVATKAADNVNYFSNAKNAYAAASKTYDEQYAAWDKLDVKLETQEAALKTLKDALDKLNEVALDNYNNGKATAADEKAIKDKEKEIKDAVAEYTNPVNYNALVALDNKATYEATYEAHVDADAAYAISSSIINTYKNFQSVELKTATEKAQVELQALLAYLTGYDQEVAEIQKEADDKYAEIVSPEQFDKDKSYKAKFEAIKAQLEKLTQALSDKINEFAKQEVTNSVAEYDAAIKTSKAKVAKFSATDKDLTEGVVNGLFADIDKQLSAINDVKDNDAKIKDLDRALLDAENATTGIKAAITNVEQTQAQIALQTVVTANTNNGYLTGDDLTTFQRISSTVNNDKAACVESFNSYKTTLNDLKAKADQNKKNDDAIKDARDVRDKAKSDVDDLASFYKTVAAGHEVKADVEKLQADYTAISGNVNIGNAADWKAKAQAISEGVTQTYNTLFDKEVAVIEGLIKTAKEELLTYSYDGNDELLKKDALSANVAAVEKNFGFAKEDVAKEKDPVTKKKALSDPTYANYLQGIESELNAYIKTITTGNGTYMNDAIAKTLNETATGLENRATTAFYSLYGQTYNSGVSYRNYSENAIAGDFQNILNALTEVRTYVTWHSEEISAYRSNAEAMLADITKAVEKLEADAPAEYDRQTTQFERDDKTAIANAWVVDNDLITEAEDKLNFLKGELALYKSADNYKNKVSQLENQIKEANSIYDAQKADVENKSFSDQYTAATTTAKNAIKAALNGVVDNCDDIVKLAKKAYVEGEIAKLTAQIVADTWTNNSNYTSTDKNALTVKLDALVKSVNDLSAKALYKQKAEDVLTTLEEGATQFAKDLASLKDDIKNMSLVEDKRGHVANDGQNEEITTDDLEALADVILDGKEGEADQAACDINGDGEVDVTDLVWLRYFLVHEDWPATPAAARQMASGANDAISMQVVSTNGNITRLAINLTNETAFKDFQLNVQLPAGAKVVGKSLGERVEGVNLISSQSVEGSVNFVALATSKGVINGEEGVVLYLDVENLNGVVTIGKAVFVDTSLNGHDLTGTSEATGIRETIANALDSATQKFYDVSGRMLNSLKNGINIIRNADGTSKKVLK